MSGSITRDTVGGATIAQLAVGGVWLAGAAFNLLVTRQMEDPYGWLADGSPIPVYRWFFGEVVAARPEAWTIALAIGEATIGICTLSRGRWSQAGLVGGAIFSGLLFSLATPYTLVMGPYALLLAWLDRRQQRSRSLASSAIPRTT